MLDTSDDVITTLNDLKVKKQIRYMACEINGDFKHVMIENVVDKTTPPENDYAAFLIRVA